MMITAMLLAATLAERNHIEQTIGSLEERFSKAFHAAPVAIWIADYADGRFIDVNEEFCDVLGYERDEVVGKTRAGSQYLGSTPKPARRLSPCSTRTGASRRFRSGSSPSPARCATACSRSN